MRKVIMGWFSKIKNRVKDIAKNAKQEAQDAKELAEII